MRRRKRRAENRKGLAKFTDKNADEQKARPQQEELARFRDRLQKVHGSPLLRNEEQADQIPKAGTKEAFVFNLLERELIAALDN
jgi:hypothetical protein